MKIQDLAKTIQSPEKEEGEMQPSEKLYEEASLPFLTYEDFLKL